MSAIIARLPEEERLILQLRFEGGMPVAQIAAAHCRLEQKVTYRRMEHRMREIRAEAAARAGASTARAALDLIGSDEAQISTSPRKRGSASVDSAR